MLSLKYNVIIILIVLIVEIQLCAISVARKVMLQSYVIMFKVISSRETCEPSTIRGVVVRVMF